MAGLGLSLGAGLGSPSSTGSAPAPAINPNLLTKTEQFDNAAWVKTGASVIANGITDPLMGASADTISFSSTSGTIAETSATAAGSGIGSAARVPLAAWTRYSVTAILDVGTYTFSIWMRDPGANDYSVTLRIDVSGGFIRCTLRDTGDLASFYAWGAKLETGASATGDASTYGVVN
jgi:hypothetical protein